MKANKEKGFTLLEILVAIAILALTGVTLISASSNHISNQGVLKQNQFAQWVASNRLVEINLEKKWPIENNKKGKMMMANEEFYWQQEVTKTADSNMVKVDVIVYEDDGYKSPVITLGTYIANTK
ncbi:type II secretion system minor pseudopilin GspI [Catenovulum sp. SM1970]|uniref:type II secretion system minor pseudopilin GspI n=1 Tax=Marinifaba aquimaris TaxID=2741323 RepID=UPI0015725765|nr:type II secretion system minor pseudopilin GspI [Marinifaba aquimaris]NTS75840.1 type II secretion system minor pseudopilin GspI [Marinifaba aquimaris]